MKLQRFGIALTLINLVLLAVVLAELRPAAAQDAAPMLRGRGLQIVDAQGRIRAEITVHPPTRVGSKLYPETVLLRLTDPRSGPVVKLTASEEGSALGLSDDSDGGVLIHARGTGSFLKVANRNGREQVIKP